MRAHARWTLLILFAVLVSLLPAADVYARRSVDATDAAISNQPPLPTDEPPPPAPDNAMVPPPVVPVPALPVSDTDTPILLLTLAVNPDPIMVGQTAVISLTVSNQSTNRADDVALRLPLPAGSGATALPDTSFQSSSQAWLWNVGTVNSYASAVVTTSVRIDALPAGEALVLQPTVTASDLPNPSGITGGAIIIPATATGTSSAARASTMSTTTFRPGSTASLRSPDAKVSVTMGKRAASEPMNIQFTRQPARGKQLPKTIGNKRGLVPFFLTAVNQAGKSVHSFGDAVTIQVRYTPEQLLVRGINESDLQIFWYDDRTLGKETWLSVPTTVDPRTRTATAVVDHFTPWTLGDGSMPSEAFIPSMQAWQTSLYTGAATYGMPIEVPAGPGGLKPSLDLSYSSSATDGTGGERPDQQSGWVGKGWSLDTGAISRNKIKPNGVDLRRPSARLILDGLQWTNARSCS